MPDAETTRLAQGYGAYLDGRARSDSPCALATPDAALWFRGWRMGDDEAMAEIEAVHA